MPLVEEEIKDKIGLITMNYPEKRNALSAELMRELVDAFQDFQRRGMRVAILKATAGSNVWSSGIDVTELPRSRRDPLGYFDPIEKVLRAVQEYPGPVIAMVHGGVWGGACDLVMTCDMVVGDETSSFAITPARIGLPYNVSGILHFMNRLGLNEAKEMFFTANPVTAEEAERIGVLNHLVPSAKLMEFTMGLAKRIASHSPLAISVIKEQFKILSSAHPIAPEGFERIQGLRRRVYDSHDYEEGIRAFLEKRAPNFTGE
ncbi:MAG: methylmalonyl-CoA decarboxylase [Promethearchaeati archaeon SRVP18_Atabeyarchaeia-1]